MHLNTYFKQVATTPSLCAFFTSGMAWVDIIAVVPYFIVLAIDKNKLQSLGFLRIVRLARVTRMFRLSKHSARLNMVAQILVSCIGDFKTILMCVVMIVCLAGSVIVYLEGEGVNGSGFTSIPQGMYWATITLTTVGYGDIYPLSVGGRIFAASFMLFGAATLTIPLLSIVVQFEKHYQTS